MLSLYTIIVFGLDFDLTIRAELTMYAMYAGLCGRGEFALNQVFGLGFPL
jgi:hypothetical protein